MSETDIRETAAQRRARERREQGEQEQGEQEQGEQEQGEQGEQSEPTPEQIAEAEKIAAIGQPFHADSAEFQQETAPVRKRKPVQIAMDAVAAQAYSDWVAGGRQTVWSRMPVITYFLSPDDVAGYRTLIRKACLLVTPESYEKDGATVEPSGVRARFGKEFTLSEKMASKIGRPDDAGKTVLAWAAIDKRHNTGQNGDDSE
jgi:hypothetical protein